MEGMLRYLAVFAGWLACALCARGQEVPIPPGPPMRPVESASPMREVEESKPPVEQRPIASSDAPTGRQEPAVSLEWICPQTVRLGQPVTCQIIVRNVSATTVHQVVVRNRLPAGVTLKASEPKPLIEKDVLRWDVGTLQPRQSRRIDVQVVPDAKGDVDCHAYVTFTGASVARLKVREPKLVLKASAPEKVLVGDPATITLTVSNPGDGAADHVKVRATLPEGLEHSRGRVVEFDLGSLDPNATRSVQLVCNTRDGGPQKCEIVAMAEGNLTSADVAAVEVILPRLDLHVAGPRLRYLDRQATYVFRVTNPGSAPATNVTVTEQLPAGFKFVSASNGGRHDFAAKTVSWYVGDLPPGESKEVKLDVLAVNAGDHRHKVSATAARNVKSDAEHVTRVEGLSALLMELVDLDDPVEVGSDTSYEIRVTNTGSKTETDLQLICTIPEKMEFRGATSTTNVKFEVRGRDVVFEPLPKLAPRADVIFKVKVRGAAPGDLRFRARITADGLSEAVLKEESTKVYGDEIGPKD